MSNKIITKRLLRDAPTRQVSPVPISTKSRVRQQPEAQHSARLNEVSETLAHAAEHPRADDLGVLAASWWLALLRRGVAASDGDVVPLDHRLFPRIVERKQLDPFWGRQNLAHTFELSEATFDQMFESLAAHIKGMGRLSVSSKLHIEAHNGEFALVVSA